MKSRLLLWVTASAWGITPVIAQTYPIKPVRMVIGATPGTGPEAIARHLAARMSEALGQQVVVDPRPGATGLIGADIVAKSAPDGYTLWFITSTQLLGTMLYQRHSLTHEFAAVGLLSSTAFGIAVNSSLPVNNIAELIAYAKSRPTKLLYGSNGQGATTHVCMEMLNALATKIMLSADMQEKLLVLGTEPSPSTPAEFAARLKAETSKWAKLMKEANIRPTD